MVFINLYKDDDNTTLNQHTKTLALKIETIEEEIKSVGVKVEKFEQILQKKKWTIAENHLYGNRDNLRVYRDKLLDKEKQLRDKEKQLREELSRNRLICYTSFSRNYYLKSVF
jgi:predicted phage tail protein